LDQSERHNALDGTVPGHHRDKNRYGRGEFGSLGYLHVANVKVPWAVEWGYSTTITTTIVRAESKTLRKGTFTEGEPEGNIFIHFLQTTRGRGRENQAGPGQQKCQETVRVSTRIGVETATTLTERRVSHLSSRWEKKNTMKNETPAQRTASSNHRKKQESAPKGGDRL